MRLGRGIHRHLTSVAFVGLNVESWVFRTFPRLFVVDGALSPLFIKLHEIERRRSVSRRGVWLRENSVGGGRNFPGPEQMFSLPQTDKGRKRRFRPPRGHCLSAAHSAKGQRDRLCGGSERGRRIRRSRSFQSPRRRLGRGKRLRPQAPPGRGDGFPPCSAGIGGRFRLIDESKKFTSRTGRDRWQSDFS